ncbi:MAG TPA: ABC transporter ATP-binding protein [Planctomycetota bacterium]|nr:ABC transporter ATP-binding protein [Planctomycetota bacterium]
MSAPYLRVRDLVKVYGKRPWKAGFRALDGVDLEVGPGVVFGLLGPNGAGKTTLVKILLGLVRGYEGEAQLFGEPVGRAAPRARVGYLPEAHRLPGYLTGWQVLDLFGRLCGKDGAQLRARIPELLDTVGMAEAAHRKVREYSKGMQQRVGLAQAMIHEPDLLILDEPTDGVDPVGRAAIRDVVLELKRRGTSIFINSHLLMEVEQICDRVVIMDRGRILREGSIADLTPDTGVVRFDLEPVPEDLEALLAGLGRGLARHARGFEFSAAPDDVDAAIDRLRVRGVSIRALQQRRLNLEQAFIDLMRKERE